MSVKQIEEAIARLPEAELKEFIAWMEAHYNNKWDAKTANDLSTGKLDDWIAEVEADYQAGLAKPLCPPFLG